jgi:hypothetical protein
MTVLGTPRQLSFRWLRCADFLAKMKLGDSPLKLQSKGEVNRWTCRAGGGEQDLNRWLWATEGSPLRSERLSSTNCGKALDLYVRSKGQGKYEFFHKRLSGWSLRRSIKKFGLGMAIMALASCGKLNAGGIELHGLSLAISDNGDIIVSVQGRPGSLGGQLMVVNADTGDSRPIDLPKEVSWTRPEFNPVNTDQIVVEGLCYEKCKMR